MPKFVAHAELAFDAENVSAAGKRLRELTEAARKAGFDLIRARVEPEPPDTADDHHESWRRYAP
jgi:hypothetical protein